MKRTFMLLLFLFATIWVNAQRGYYHQSNNWQRPQRCGTRVFVNPPRFGCNNYNRRPFINVVIAPRPRVVTYQVSAPQPQVVREWIEPHWEETPNGRIWIEGHYVQREVY